VNERPVSSPTPSAVSFYNAPATQSSQHKPSPTRLVLASEQTLLLEGLASLCNAIQQFEVVGKAGNGQQALEQLETLKPEIALIDLEMTDILALEVIKRAMASRLATRCAVFSSRKDRKTVMDALRSGACGFLLKNATKQQLDEALKNLMEGGIYVSPQIELASLVYEGQQHQRTADPIDSLSSREYQVFSLLVEGVRAKEIAARLTLSPKTVDTYRASLMRKLEIHDVAGLVKFAMQRNLTT
jgi:DNA-binding NarL/FixJ family response regulator